MSNSHNAFIIGTGRFLPKNIVHNHDFMQHEFLTNKGEAFGSDNATIIKKFYEITGIQERKYADNDMVASDLGYHAAANAIQDAGIDQETLDYIIVAHNFGDVAHGSGRVDIMPALASRIKQKLKIKNPYCVAYDLPFGCPGWVEGLIQANYFIRSGDAKNILVIGTETLSRVVDPYDRDSMIYADGAGATILSATNRANGKGILAHLTRSDAQYANLLWMGKTYQKDSCSKDIYIKMHGRKLYSYAISTVPQLIKDCISKAGIQLGDVKKVLIHQANEKMDQAMLERVFQLYDCQDIPPHIMPMIIHKIGNNSVATVPVLLDLIRKEVLDDHRIHPGDHIVFASVGAGMNCNAIVYRA